MEKSHIIPTIVIEVSEFLAANSDVSERELALRAGVSPVVLNRVMNRRRVDMSSDKADKLRSAMRLFYSSTPVADTPDCKTNSQ